MARKAVSPGGFVGEQSVTGRDARQWAFVSPDGIV